MQFSAQWCTQYMMELLPMKQLKTDTAITRRRTCRYIIYRYLIQVFCTGTVQANNQKPDDVNEDIESFGGLSREVRNEWKKRYKIGGNWLTRNRVPPLFQH